MSTATWETKSTTWETKDSGERQVFETGAQRDTAGGKLRYDLIPSHALARVAGLYARGAEKYNDHNWTKGIPYSRMLASLERHLNQFKQGDRDEDHLAAVVWNALGIMHFQEVGYDELDDLPRFNETPRGWYYDDDGERVPWRLAPQKRSTDPHGPKTSGVGHGG